MAGWGDWLGKKVYIELISGRRYTGIVTEVDDRGVLVFFCILDKFQKKVCFVSSELKVIQEEC